MPESPEKASQKSETKENHQKELTKILIDSFDLSPAEKRAFLIDIMQDLDLIHFKMIKEIER